MAWYDNIDTRGYNNMLGTQAWPGYNPNLFQGMGVGRFDAGNLMRPDNLTQDLGAATYRAPPLQEEIINEDIHLDVGNNLPIFPNVPRPGENWPGFGIPRALAETAFRIKGGPYYSEKFPNRTFTEGDRTYNQSGLGGYFSPDEVFNMQQFGGVGESDPRVDKFGKNIVSFADDYEEGLEDWVSKYGKRYSTDARFLKRRADKIAMLQQIQDRRAAIEAANRAASAQNLANVGIQVGGGGAFEDPGGRDRGGQGAFREDVTSMRSAGRSYKDAQGNVGYSRGRKEGGRIGYANGEFVDEDINIQGPGFDVNENVMMASAPDPMDALNDMSMNIFGKPLHKLTGEEYQMLIDMANDQTQRPEPRPVGDPYGTPQGEEIVEEGIASLV
jgi:hypothetical protein